MAIRNIVKVGDEILTKKCKKVTNFDQRLWNLLDDMRETMEEANGVGLAAPQVGVLKNLALVDNGEEIVELINPEIIEADGAENALEGCLSVPEQYGYVNRPTMVIATYQDRFGDKKMITAYDLTARAVCHELDHLNGKLFTRLVTEFVDIEDLENEER